MTNNINENILRDNIKGYIEEKGWKGFFGLLATISPNKVDKNDLKEFKTELPAHEDIPRDNETKAIINNASFNEASIYAEKHIPAVQEDLKEQSLNKGKEGIASEDTKTKILTQSKNLAPNPWGESKVVLPGELDLK